MLAWHSQVEAGLDQTCRPAHTWALRDDAGRTPAALARPEEMRATHLLISRRKEVPVVQADRAPANRRWREGDAADEVHRDDLLGARMVLASLHQARQLTLTCCV